MNQTLALGLLLIFVSLFGMMKLDTHILNSPLSRLWLMFKHRREQRRMNRYTRNMAEIGRQVIEENRQRALNRPVVHSEPHRVSAPLPPLLPIPPIPPQSPSLSESIWQLREQARIMVAERSRVAENPSDTARAQAAKQAANEKRKATRAAKKAAKEAENAAKLPHNRLGKRIIDD